ncbi:MAG: hypothetical protein N3G80_02945 [Candidatus Micrarchaeota archaeon]|nr:hypothetical protein [Candidatus Micrarchaeota archaeon]
MRWMIFIVLGFLLFADTVYAITNATLSTQVNRARWTGTAGAASRVTEGGNISNVNISGVVQLTTKWADFFGTVSGAAIRLQDSAENIVYSWAYSTANGSGEVCLSTASAFPGPTLSGANLSAMNTLWSLGTIDNATNTFNTTSSINISGQLISGAPASKLQGSSSFTVVALFNGTTTTKNAFAFCTNLNNTGKNYANEGVHYEIMVPTTPSAVETYYFYIELET